MGLNPRGLANGILTEYCNNSPEFGVTGRAGGMLSMIDSQQLLTYDNLTTAGSFSDMDVSSAALSLWLFCRWAVLACGLTRRLYLLS